MKLLIEVTSLGYVSAEAMRLAIIESTSEAFDSVGANCKVLWAEETRDFEW